ncbi:vWFA domain containing protein [uncultured Caudovirales phage]|uniref:VWFA domain containing protein n=1 Tax=uncultured Caudovirales phage TaxID=2100421 RepID=A0A6J5NT22_9CAUD|nr:vWFA domain containing protein [uncultured Caudovirales phage]
MNVYILLDRSGSMQNLWDEALGAINMYVDKLSKETNVYMAVFDTDYEVIRQSNAGSWKPVTNEDASPRGMTALYDASARIIQRAIDDNSEKTVVVVMTDGEENSSKNYRHADVKDLVAKVDAKKWELIFLGANFDKVGNVAASYGRTNDKFVNMSEKGMRNFMSGTLATSTMAYASGAAAMSFTDKDKKEANAIDDPFQIKLNVAVGGVKK